MPCNKWPQCERLNFITLATAFPVPKAKHWNTMLSLTLTRAIVFNNCFLLVSMCIFDFFFSSAWFFMNRCSQFYVVLFFSNLLGLQVNWRVLHGNTFKLMFLREKSNISALWKECHILIISSGLKHSNLWHWQGHIIFSIEN